MREDERTPDPPAPPKDERTPEERDQRTPEQKKAAAERKQFPGGRLR